MFGGYSEVAAYYVDPDPIPQTGYLEKGPLPSDYIPVSPNLEPWYRGAVCQKDFILIAEFSELEGPKPLITIPKDSCQGCGAFDLNDFSVRIMSVDHQTMAGENFNLCEDSHVVMSESKHGIYCYVHHFTLYDSHARGFVRPFCMTYVTPDFNKLMSFHEEMISEFSKVAHCFKYGNIHLFIKDMTHYLSDLMYTKERFAERKRLLNEITENERDVDVALANALGDPAEEAILETVTEQGLNTIINEVKHILDTTSGLVHDEDLEQRFRKLEERSKTDPDTIEDVQEHSLDNFQYSCSFHSNMDIHNSTESCSSHSNIKRSGSFADFDSSWSLDASEMYKPRVVRTTNKKRFDKSLRTLHELCRWGAKEGLNRLRSVHRYFSRDMTTLQIERRDATAIEPSSGLLTIGRNVQLNFLTSEEGDRGLSSLEAATCSLVSSPTGNLTRKWLSDDTLASFHSAESFLSCTEEVHPSSADLHDNHHEPTFIMGQAYVEEKSSSSSSYELAPTTSSLPMKANTHTDPLTIPRSTPGSGEGGSERSSSENGVSAQAKPWESDSGYTVVRPNSLQIETTTTPIPRVSVISAADHITNLTPSSPGYGILKFVNQYQCAPHVLYSLLCGRPLVVIAGTKHEKEVRAIVSALWLCVPGHLSHSHSVLPWSSKPLRLCDLTRLKLVGLGRPEKKSHDYMVPSSVKKYVSILNLETKTFYSPPYQGGILTEVAKKKKSFKNDSSFISYLHSVLYSLSHKAMLYYHAFSTSEAAATNTITDTITLPERSLYKQECRKFCNQLRLGDSDVIIVQYLVEVIQLQQIHDLHLQQHAYTDLPASTTKLDYRKCSVFKMS